MFRLLIVDDEFHIRKRLESKVNWADIAISEITVCDDGDTALEHICQKTYDILLTDIKMPRMNGLDLAYRALELKPDMKIILMSVYDDKAYLKKAIDIRAVDYLEKPFSIQDVEQAVTKAVEDLKKARQKEQKYLNESAAMESLVLCDAANALCRNSSEMPAAIEKIRSVKPDFMKGSTFVSIIADLSKANNILDAEMFPYPSTERIGLMCTELPYPTIFFMVSQEKIGFHLSLTSDYPLKEAVELLRKYIRIYFPKISFILSVGSEVSVLPTLYRSYQDATIGCERAFFTDQTILYPQPSGDILPFYSFREEDVVTFQQALRTRNEEYCREFVNNLHKSLSMQKGILIRTTKNFYMRLISRIMQEGAANHCTALENAEGDLWEALERINSLDETTKYIIGLLDLYFAEVAPSDSVSITAIVQYLHDHVGDASLSLSDISNAHYMSIPYLCAFFREHMGQSIKAYLIAYRMNMARDLLRSSNMRVSQVAELCGFSDASYFSKRFTKFFGVQPTKLRDTDTESREEEE